MPQIPYQGLNLMEKLGQAEKIKGMRQDRELQGDKMAREKEIGDLTGKAMSGGWEDLSSLASKNPDKAQAVQAIKSIRDENVLKKIDRTNSAIAKLAKWAKTEEEWKYGINDLAMQGIFDQKIVGKMSDSFKYKDKAISDAEDVSEAIKRQHELIKIGSKKSPIEQNLTAEGYTPGTPEYQKRAKELNSKAGVNINLNTGKQAPTKKIQNDIQEGIRDSQQALKDLGRIADTHSEEFLTTVGRFKAALGKVADKFGVDPAGLASFNAERSKFSTNVKQFFNQYRKDITGAAASAQELEQLIDSLFSDELGPLEFKARFGEISDKMQANLEMNQKQAREGIEVGGPTQTTGQAQPGYAEGQTATNPTTGEKMVFRGGQWQNF
jgi:hypothetical protein